MTEFELVERPETIRDAVSKAETIGIDTEFVRERTYHAQLCLLQISTPAHIYCVDTLADAGLDALWQPLLGRTWVLHAARQDLEVVYQASGDLPAAVFDTQIAAGLAGLPPQLGYAALVEEVFGTSLAKSHTRANWARRPLAEGLLRYAAEDVEFLLPLFETLCERLDAQGRLAWAHDDAANLNDPALYRVAPDAAVERLKAARNLRGRRYAVAATIASWRERAALKRDLPRQWVLKDNAIIAIAKQLPRDLDALASIEELPPKLIARHGRRLLELVRDPEEPRAAAPNAGRPDETQKAALKRMQALVADTAAGLGIAAESLASKKELSAVLIGGERDSRLLSGWRRELLGDALLALL